MKEYKTMYKIDLNGMIEEVAVSMITKDGWVKYYPMRNGKAYKRDGLCQTYIDSSFEFFRDNIDEANKLAKEIRLGETRRRLESAEAKLPHYENIFCFLRAEYLKKLQREREAQDQLKKDIETYKKEIKELME